MPVVDEPDIIKEMSMAIAPEELVRSTRVTKSWRLSLAAAALSPHLDALCDVARAWAPSSDVRVVALSRCSDPLRVVGDFGGAGLDRLGVAANPHLEAGALSRWMRVLDWRLRWRAWQNPAASDQQVANAIYDSIDELRTDRRAAIAMTRLHINSAQRVSSISSLEPAVLSSFNAAAAGWSPLRARQILAVSGQGLGRGALATLRAENTDRALLESVAHTSLARSLEYALHPDVQEDWVGAGLRERRARAKKVRAVLAEQGMGGLSLAERKEAMRLGACDVTESLAESDPLWWASQLGELWRNDHLLCYPNVIRDVLARVPAAYSQVAKLPRNVLDGLRSFSAVVEAGLALGWGACDLSWTRDIDALLGEAAAVLGQDASRFDVWWAMLAAGRAGDVNHARQALSSAVMM